jgi:hypothetical protein
MTNITVTGQEAYFNENVTFFKNVFLNSISSVNSINGVLEFSNGSVNFNVPVNLYVRSPSGTDNVFVYATTSSSDPLLNPFNITINFSLW